MLPKTLRRLSGRKQDPVALAGVGVALAGVDPHFDTTTTSPARRCVRSRRSWGRSP